MSESFSNLDPFAMLEFVTIPTWVYDPTDLRIVATNEAAISRYGYSREEFTTMTLAALHPDSAEETRLGSAGIRRHRLRDGSILFVDVQVRQVRVLGRDWRVKTAYDVTPLRRTEEDLVESRALLSDAERLAQVGTWIAGIGPSARADWSPGTYRIHGVPVGTPVTVSTFFDLVHPDDRDRVRAYIASVHANDLGDSAEFRIVRPDGALRWCLVHGTAVRDDDGQATRILGTVQDVTDRHLAMEHLRASEARFRAFVESNLIGFASGRVAGPIVEANQAFLDMAGYTRAELKSGAIRSSALRASHQPSAEDCAGREPDSVGSHPYETELVRPDERRVPVLVGAAQPAPEEMIAFVVDLTERRAMEQRLALSDRLATIGTLAAGVAHELNNPLTYVTTNVLLAQEMLQEIDAPSDLVGCIADARLGSDRMAAIIRDLRLLSRPQQDDVVLVDLESAIDVALRMAVPTFRSRASLVRDKGPVPRVRANEARLTQVVLNLVVNAGQAIPEGDFDNNRITVATRTTPEGAAILEVSDTGCGIPPELQKRIFEPFFTTKPSGVGTGLGLAIARQIVAEAGGHLEVESAVGQGTLFRIMLPAAAKEVAAFEVAASKDGGRRHLLSVDDDPLIGKMLRRLLPEYDLVAVNSASAAITRLDAGENFDAILCDMKMPAMSGLDFYETVCSRDQLLAHRILFFSGEPDACTVLPRELQARLLAKFATRSQLVEAIASVTRPSEIARPLPPAPLHICQTRSC